MKRRELLKALMYGGAGAGFTLSQLTRRNGLDNLILPERSFDSAVNLMRYGLHPHFLSSEAYGESAYNSPCIITIRVMNLIHTPLCFKFANYTGTNSTYRLRWENKIQTKTVYDTLMAAGLDSESDNPRWKALHLNKWWSKILATGLDETGRAPSFLSSDDYGDFPDESQVAFQAAVHINQTYTTLNHSFQNTTLVSMPDNRGGDINYHLDTQKIVNSPLGLTCLSMGNTVETTDGPGFVANRILGSDLRRVVVGGQTVEKFIRLLAQSIGPGFIDDSLLATFDGLAKTDTSLRSSIQVSKSAIQDQLAKVQSVAPVMNTVHDSLDRSNYANSQGLQGGIKTALYEFVSECLFVKRALDIPGKPLRNFSLLLNMFDLDGLKLDITSNGSGQFGLSYVEGMRQLAMGLNILAQAIKKHGNVYVVVVSEGGRGANSGDNKVGHTFLMGPGGSTSTSLVDHLYADLKAVDDEKDPFVVESNEGNANAGNSPGLTLGGAGLRYFSDKSVCSNDGTPVQEFANVGSFLLGVVKHLEQRYSVPKSTTSGMGNFVRIKTKAA